jgi:hypothetical protein
VVVEDGSNAESGVIKRFAAKRLAVCKSWGQVLGMKSAASLPGKATRIAFESRVGAADPHSSELYPPPGHGFLTGTIHSPEQLADDDWRKNHHRSHWTRSLTCQCTACAQLRRTRLATRARVARAARSATSSIASSPCPSAPSSSNLEWP